ncbi:hypothetical protein TNCV_3829471 [Trichonephila clavipes]|nr:hypothetical protein TNCV_3829471 [Trichonephila clavipes]
MCWIPVVVIANATCLMVSDRRPRNSTRQRTRCTPVVRYAGDSLIWLGSAPVLRENTWRWSRACLIWLGSAPVLRENTWRWSRAFQQSRERSCDSMAI